jgi:hypothetical protein
VMTQLVNDRPPNLLDDSESLLHTAQMACR